MTAKTFKDTVLGIVKHYINSTIKLSMPAKVVSVEKYQSRQQIDVIPLINTPFEDSIVLEFPTIHDVTVCLIEGGGALFSVPIKVGDTVRLDFSRDSLDEYLESSGTDTQTPVDKRKFALTDVFATPGCPTTKSTLSPDPDNVELKFADSKIIMYPSGDVDIRANRDALLWAGRDIDATCDGDAIISAVGDMTLTATNVEITSATLTHNGTNIGDTHTHVGSASAPSGPQVNTGTPV